MVVHATTEPSDNTAIERLRAWVQSFDNHTRPGGDYFIFGSLKLSDLRQTLDEIDSLTRRLREHEK